MCVGLFLESTLPIVHVQGSPLVFTFNVSRTHAPFGRSSSTEENPYKTQIKTDITSHHTHAFPLSSARLDDRRTIDRTIGPSRSVTDDDDGSHSIDRSIDRRRSCARDTPRRTDVPVRPRVRRDTPHSTSRDARRRCSRNEPPRRSRRARCARPPPEAVARSRRAPGLTVRCGAWRGDAREEPWTTRRWGGIFFVRFASSTVRDIGRDHSSVASRSMAHIRISVSLERYPLCESGADRTLSRARDARGGGERGDDDGDE